MVLRRNCFLLLLFSLTVSLSVGLAPYYSPLPRRHCSISTINCSQINNVGQNNKLMAQFSQTMAVTSLIFSISIQHLAATAPYASHNAMAMQQFVARQERVIDVRNTPLSLQCPIVGEWKTLRTGAKIVARKYSKRLKVARIGAKLGMARSTMLCRLSLIRSDDMDQ
jgi:hypothetical protein